MRNGSLALALAAALAGCTEAQPCPEPLEVCGGVCVATLSDVENCGACARRCAAGLSCLGGECMPTDEQAPCVARTGGAWVTLETCGQSMKAWIDAGADGGTFIPGAEGLLLSLPPPYPVFEVSDGTDCDGQWTWHVEPTTARLEPSPLTTIGCAACPGEVEASKGAWIGQEWCPGSGGQAVRFLVVQRSQ